MTLWTNGHAASQTTFVLDLRTKRDRGAGCGRLEGQPARGRTLTHTMPLGSGVRVCVCVCVCVCEVYAWLRCRRTRCSQPAKEGRLPRCERVFNNSRAHPHTPALMPQALVVLCYQTRLPSENPWFNADLLLLLVGLAHARSLFRFVKSTLQQKQTEAP